MKKTGLVRFLCLLVCVMMAAGAIGAGKPVVSVQTDDAGRLLFDGTNPGAPDPETSEEPEESAEPEPSSETEEPTDAGESAEPVNGEPLVFLYGDVPYGTGTETDSDYDGIPDEYDADPENNSFTGDLKSGHKDNTTSVGFTVDFRDFFDNNTVYHPNLATFSVMGAALAYMGRNSTYDNAYFVFSEAPALNSTGSKVDGAGLMETFGFQDVKDYTLDSYGDDDLCEVVIGHRTVTFEGATKIIVAIWVRGTDSTSAEEWSSNFHMGDLVRFFDEYDSVAGKSPRQENDDWTRKTNHRGFDVCATRLLNYLKTYYLDAFVEPELQANPQASLTYWITGHSRGAAVGNLMASYLIDEGNEVFAYTFAAPYNTANTEASAERYDCIFNLVNSNDFIPMLPMPEWGFTRYGRTAAVDASQYASLIKSLTGETYDGNYLAASDMSTLLGKFICITGENADRNNPGKILGWREVYVYHCGHTHEGETVGDDQSTTFVKKQSITNWGGPTESGYNGYAIRLRKYSYWNDGICETPAYDLQVLVELLVAVANGETLGGASTFITSNKLADKFDFDKWSLISYANKLTEPHFMDTYSVIQAQINEEGDPGARFHTLQYYTDSNAVGGRPVHTHTYTPVPYEGQEPTCTEEGLGYRYCLCSKANADFYDDYQKNVPIAALGHEWGEPTYEWTKTQTGYSVTATRVCARDPEHIETETVDATALVTLQPTCTDAGETTYTATFANEAFAKQSKTLTDVDPLGHDWGEPAYEWTETQTGYTVTATRKCARDPEHIESETVEAVLTVIAPTASTPCRYHYTATFANEAFAEQTKDVTVEPVFIGNSLLLSGQIGVKIYMELPEIEGIDYANSYMTYTITGDGSVTERCDFNANVRDPSGRYYGFICYINAIQMADTITATFHYGEGLTMVYITSVKMYLDKFEAVSAQFGEKTRALIHSVADYGYYVQPFLARERGWNLDTDYAKLENHFAESFDYTEILNAVSSHAIGKTFNGSEVTDIRHSLLLASETVVNVYFTTASGYTGPIGATVDGKPADVEYVSSLGMYRVEISGIYAQKLGDRHTVVITTANGGATVQVSGLSYVHALLSSDMDSVAKDAASAIYQYYAAAAAYSGNH